MKTARAGFLYWGLRVPRQSLSLRILKSRPASTFAILKFRPDLRFAARRALCALALPFVFRAASVFAPFAALLPKLSERGKPDASEVSEITKLSARIPAVAPSAHRPLRVLEKVR